MADAPGAAGSLMLQRMDRRGHKSGVTSCDPAPAGLPFWPRLHSHTPMNPDLENVIRQALGDAQAAGKDYLSQTELAVRAVQRARPDMPASDALAAVTLMQRP